MEYFWTILDLFDLLFNRERILPRKFDHISEEAKELYALMIITMAMFYDNDQKVTKEEQGFLDELILEPLFKNCYDDNGIIKRLRRKNIKPEKVRSTLIDLGISTDQCVSLINQIKSRIRLVSEPQYIKFLDDLQKKYNF
jgi:hypothetical protein